METTYTAEGNKLKEATNVPQELTWTWIEILSAIQDLQTQQTNLTASIDAQIAVWEKRKAEAVKLGLDTV